MRERCLPFGPLAGERFDAVSDLLGRAFSRRSGGDTGDSALGIEHDRYKGGAAAGRKAIGTVCAAVGITEPVVSKMITAGLPAMLNSSGLHLVPSISVRKKGGARVTDTRTNMVIHKAWCAHGEFYLFAGPTSKYASDVGSMATERYPRYNIVCNP